MSDLVSLCACGCGGPLRVETKRPARQPRFINGHTRKLPAEAKFFPNFTPTPGEACWEWTGYISSHGYGAFFSRSTGRREMTHAHRYSYEHYVGAIPDGLVIDHLCENRRCVNPDHLEPVTPAVNARRGYHRTEDERPRKRGGSVDE